MNFYFDTKFFQKKKFDKRTILKYFRNAIEDFRIAFNDRRPAVIFNFSYSALIKIGITLIALQGYRTKSRRGHHVKILEKLSEILNNKDIEIIGDRMRKKRNLDLYEGGIIIDSKEVRQYLNFVEETSRKYFIGYWKDTVKFLVVRFHQDHLTLWIRIQGYKLDDPKHITKLLNRKSEYWKKIYKEIRLKSIEQIPDVMYLVKQAYEKAEQRV